MEFVMEMMRIVLPIVITGGIALFVVLRMKHKYKKGTLGKKASKNAQILLNSLIPLGMILGSVCSMILSIIFPISLLTTIGYGPGIGLLFGYFAYEIYSKNRESYS